MVMPMHIIVVFIAVFAVNFMPKRFLSIWNIHCVAMNVLFIHLCISFVKRHFKVLKKLSHYRRVALSFKISVLYMKSTSASSKST